MSKFFKDRFQDRDYIATIGVLEEERLLGVNHICIHEDCVILNDLVIPFGAKDIEEKTTFVIDDILDTIIPIIQKPENKEKTVTICGSPAVKRMLGRKLEDRTKRKVEY